MNIVSHVFVQSLISLTLWLLAKVCRGRSHLPRNQMVLFLLCVGQEPNRPHPLSQ